jgi:hypothetical protein
MRRLMGNEQLNHLIARYEQMAVEEDARADWLVSMAMRHGWTERVTEHVEELRLYAVTNRALAQEVRDLSE